MIAHPQTISADKLLAGVHSELHRCIALLLRIEDEVLPLVAHPMAASLRAAMQDIDLLSQCIDDIARCVNGLQTSEARVITVDAEAILSNIRLQDMRVRLEGGTFDTRKLENREELFDAPQAAAGGHQLF